MKRLIFCTALAIALGAVGFVLAQAPIPGSTAAIAAGNPTCAINLILYNVAANTPGCVTGAFITSNFLEADNPIKIRVGSSLGAGNLYNDNATGNTILRQETAAHNLLIQDHTQTVLTIDDTTHAVGISTVAFASLPAVPAAGEALYCTNCTTAATCAGSGSGHLAVSNGTAWTCQ